MTFGEALLMLMQQQGITPTELSRKSGVPKQTINELLKGRTKEPTFTRAKMLADGLGVTLEELARLTED